MLLGTAALVTGCTGSEDGGDGSSGITPAGTGAVSGRFELEGIGACSGLTVLLNGPDGVLATTTGSDGSFSFTALKAAAYGLSVSAAGWDPEPTVVLVTAGAAGDIGTIFTPLERVPVRGSAQLSDGGSAGGSAASVSAQVELVAPAGADCPALAGDLGDVFALEEHTIVGGDGGYEARVPRAAREARALVQRPGYTDGEAEIDVTLVATSDGREPVAVDPITLYPLTGFVNVADGKTVRNDPDVPLQISAFNLVSQMALGEAEAGLCTYGDWLPYSATTTYTLTSGDGAKTICVRVRNDRGQVLSDLTVDLVLDTTPPLPLTVEVVGAPYVADLSVTLLLDVFDTGTVTMVVSNDAVYNEAVQGFAPQVTHLLAAGDGTKVVYVRFYDEAGNQAELASAPFVLDTVPPTIPQIRTPSGTVDADEITIELFAGSVSDANFSTFELAGGADYSGGFVPVPYPVEQTMFTYRLVQDAENVLQIRARDLAGNVSPAALVVVKEDSSAPAPLYDLRIRNGDQRVTITWTPSNEPDVAGYRIYYGTQSRISYLGSETNVYFGAFADQGDSPIWLPGRASRSFTLSGLTNGNPLYVTVVPVDETGHVAEFGNEVRGLPNLVSPDLVYPQRTQSVLDPSLLSLLFTAGMVRHDDYLYVGTRGALQVWDVSTPLAPALATSVALPDAEQTLAQISYNAAQDRLYAVAYEPAANELGLQPSIVVFDVSAPEVPVYTGQTVLDGKQLPVAIASFGDRVFVSRLEFPGFVNGDHRFDVLTLADPDAPLPDTAASEVTSSLVLGIAIEPNQEYMVVSRLFDGYYLYDLSEGGLVLSGVLKGDAEVRLVAHGNYLYAPGYNSIHQLEIVAGSLQDNGEVLSFSGQELARTITIDGTTLYGFGDEGGVRVDISNPTSLTLLAQYNDNDYRTEPNYSVIAGAGPALYGSEGPTLDVYDLSSTPGRRLHGRRIRAEYHALDIHAGFVAIAEGYDGIGIYDYSTGAPVEVGRVPSSDSAARYRGVRWAVRDGQRLLYAWTDEPAQLVVVDASDPSQPVTTVIDTYADRTVADVAITATTVVVLTNAPDLSVNEVHRYDIGGSFSGEPSAPVYIDTCSSGDTGLESPLRRAAANRQGLFLVHGDSVSSIDTQATCASLQLDGPRSFTIDSGMDIAGGVLYGLASKRLYRYGVTTPAALVPIVGQDNVDFGEQNDVAGPVYHGSYLYGFGDQGLVVVNDVESSPQVRGIGTDSFGTGAFIAPRDLKIDGNWALGLTRDEGLHLWQIATPARLEADGSSGGSGGGFALQTHFGLAADSAVSGLVLYDLRPDAGQNLQTRGSTVGFGFADIIRSVDRASGMGEAYVVSRQPDLCLIDANDPNFGPKAVSCLTLPGPVSALRTDGDFAYAQVETNTILIVRLAPTYTLGTALSGGHEIRDFVASGGHVYVLRNAASDDIEVYRTASGNWTPLVTIQASADLDLLRVGVHGGRLYVFRRTFEIDQALLEYDLFAVLAGDATPTLLGESQTTAGDGELLFAGANAFVGGQALWLDLSVPGQATTLFNLSDVSGLGNLHVAGPHLVAGDFHTAVQRYQME